MVIPIIFNQKPVFTISLIFKRLLPKTMALGGVATGNIKANEAAMVAGTIKNNGLIFTATDTAANMGKNVSTVAVFDVNSVKKVMVAMTISNNTMGDRLCKAVKL